MFEDSKKRLHEYLRTEIERSGLTPIEIAQRCGFESDRPIRAIIEGNIPLPIDTAAKVAEAVSCDPDKLIVLVLETWLPHNVICRIASALGSYPPHLPR